MSPNTTASDTQAERILEAHRQSLATLEAERESLTALQGALGEFADQELQLHRSNAALLDDMRRELDRVRRQVKQLRTTRA